MPLKVGCISFLKEKKFEFDNVFFFFFFLIYDINKYNCKDF